MVRIFVTAAFVASIVPALANADGDVLTKARIVGRWAYNCDAPSSTDNAYLVYTAPADGAPTEQLIMDDAHDRVTPLSGVKLLAPDKVQWTQSSGDVTFAIVNLVELTRLKTWSSTDAKGVVYIRDGAYSDGLAAPWFNRCAAP